MIEAWEHASHWLINFLCIVTLGAMMIVVLYTVFFASRLIQKHLFPDVPVMDIPAQFHIYFWKGVVIAICVVALCFSITIAIPLAFVVGCFWISWRVGKAFWIFSGKKFN